MMINMITRIIIILMIFINIKLIIIKLIMIIIIKKKDKGTSLKCWRFISNASC